MEKTVMLILVNQRKEAADKVQKILTGWGCLIKTRLGIHDGVLDKCSESGLIILELVGEDAKKQELAHKLNLLPGVKANLVTLSVEP
ncbi:MAG: hypothetical protein WC712_10265 [Candidatus Brocadiia bacterium]